MEKMNLKQLYKVGMVGLGVMGRNLLLNMADHGFSVAGYDTDPAKVEALRKEADKRDIHCTGNLQDFIVSLQIPRSIILLVPADLRQIVCQAGTMGIPVPGIMASLGYVDAYRSSWLPANLIQAQRDYFGAHTYERLDAKGTFHTEWQNNGM
jgi:6-phosphogluconate dehydrogenase